MEDSRTRVLLCDPDPSQCDDTARSSSPRQVSAHPELFVVLWMNAVDGDTEQSIASKLLGRDTITSDFNEIDYLTGPR